MVRITTWNVNGIRNPFGYEPWRKSRTFNAMFDILEADIVIMQELKIQRKDLTDDMVLVPGWDCFFSLPKHKKGYSGVGIYTRQSVCVPIRAEEGLLGVLNAPGSPTAYKDLSEDASIGGYPTPKQVADLGVDPVVLDGEGRCVVLEFPAFVLFGVYSPANSNGLRDDFRYAFLTALDIRIRNLARMGKRVVLTGDLNVSRDEFDTAKADEAMHEAGMTRDDYFNMPNRRIFNQLLANGKVIGERDEGRETPVLWDLCREFHPTRQGMFTHWETKINARPGNFGSRIDYILCSIEMKTWFSEANIQEGLMGSDHCPVFAITKDTVDCRGEQVHILDIMNPSGMYGKGARLQDYKSPANLLAFSGRLLPEFTKRRSIKDMFAKKPTVPPETDATKEASSISQQSESDSQIITDEAKAFRNGLVPTFSHKPAKHPSPLNSPEKRRSSGTMATKPVKRMKSNVAPITSQSLAKGQRSLKGFFQTKTPEPKPPSTPDSTTSTLIPHGAYDDGSATSQLSPTSLSMDEEAIIDPQHSKDSWNKLFTKKPPPRCESHSEPCITLTTKKPGINCGRQFFICPRPLGPSGQKETGTQWRCGTFIWASEWNSSTPKT